MRGELTHGTASCYIHRQCRCDACKAAMSERNRVYNRANSQKIYAKQAALRQVNAERDREKRRAAYRANPKAGAEKTRAWRLANPGLDAAQQRARRVADPERHRGYKADRRARERAAFIEHVDHAVVFNRDGGICQLCKLLIGDAKWHVDHVIPLARGGWHCYANVQLAHASCNQAKSASLPLVPKGPIVIFDYWGRPLRYFDHLYNITSLNERRTELAVAWDWMLRNASGNGLEVGNTLGHYRPTTHLIVDQFEEPDWYQNPDDLKNIDLFNIAGRFDWIMSVSTIEHVGTDYPSEHSGLEALLYLRSLLAPGGRMLVTFPTGVNPSLDEALVDDLTGASRSATFLKLSNQEWVQSDRPEVHPYGALDHWAGAVAILEYET